MKMRGVVKGIFALSSSHAKDFYNFQELIEWVAGVLSISIERKRLSESVVKRNKELDSIKQIGSALASSTFDMDKVLKYTMDMIREVMNVEAGSLFFIDENELEFAVAFNIKLKSLKVLKDLRLKMGQGIAGYVAARGEFITMKIS